MNRSRTIVLAIVMVGVLGLLTACCGDPCSTCNTNPCGCDPCGCGPASVVAPAPTPGASCGGGGGCGGGGACG
jgi:hypothetical protein